MNYNGRALFTILKSKGLGTEPWILEDYRALPLEDLFQRLEVLGLYLNAESLYLYTDECESPEELTDLLVEEKRIRDKVYLLLFEAWRRTCPDNQSISLFCDELDHLIALYEEEKLADEEPLQKELDELGRILELEADKGSDPRIAFKEITSYSAYPLEVFLYEYISTKIDQGHSTYSSELIDRFTPYVEEPIWFNLLRIRLLPQDEAQTALDRLYETALEIGDIDLLFEALQVSLHVGTAFPEYARLLLPLLQESEKGELYLLADEYFTLTGFRFLLE